MKLKYILFVGVLAVLASCGGNVGHKDHSHDASEDHHHVAPADMKKIISARVTVKSDKVAEFIAQTKDLIEKSRAEAGCISYSLYQDPNDHTTFLFFEEWKNQDAVDFHFNTEHFQNFGKALEECASGPADITIYDSPAQTKG